MSSGMCGIVPFKSNVCNANVSNVSDVSHVTNVHHVNVHKVTRSHVSNVDNVTPMTYDPHPLKSSKSNARVQGVRQDIR